MGMLYNGNMPQSGNVSGTENIQCKLIKSPQINVNCMLKRRFEIYVSLYKFITRCVSWKLLEKEYSCHKQNEFKPRISRNRA
jgi:hypothetical protein